MEGWEGLVVHPVPGTAQGSTANPGTCPREGFVGLFWVAPLHEEGVLKRRRGDRMLLKGGHIFVPFCCSRTAGDILTHY